MVWVGYGVFGFIMIGVWDEGGCEVVRVTGLVDRGGLGCLDGLVFFIVLDV